MMATLFRERLGSSWGERALFASERLKAALERARRLGREAGSDPPGVGELAAIVIAKHEGAETAGL
jgi:hypothetical protein